MISIIIVNWNAGPQLVEVVSSIGKYHHGLVSAVVLVDNASTYDSLGRVETLPSLPFKLLVSRNSENYGFGKACNLGAQNARSDYLLFLNPDAALYADTLPKAMAYMQDPTNVKVGICGVQLLDDSGQILRHCVRFPPSMGFAAHAVGLDRFIPQLGHAMSEWDHTHTRQVDHVIGAFFLVRRELFDALQGFDERFFVYFKEVDFSYRACQAGLHSVYLANRAAVYPIK